MRARGQVMSRKQAAQHYANELDALYQKHGSLKPDLVVEWAREHPDSELHGRFEWNNTQAAHKYRLMQARQIITEVEVVYPDGSTRQVYVSPVEQRGDAGYSTLVEVISDEERRLRFLRQAVKEYRSIGLKYMDLVELSDVRAALDRVIVDEEED